MIEVVANVVKAVVALRVTAMKLLSSWQARGEDGIGKWNPVLCGYDCFPGKHLQKEQCESLVSQAGGIGYASILKLDEERAKRPHLDLRNDWTW